MAGPAGACAGKVGVAGVLSAGPVLEPARSLALSGPEWGWGRGERGWDGVCRTSLRRQTVHMHLAPCARLDVGLVEAHGSRIGRRRPATRASWDGPARVRGREGRECECV